MDVDILKKLIPDEHTLKCKSSIDELIISSHCMKMMSMPCEVSVTLLFDLYKFWIGFATLP